jgi:hypothetical protein
MRLALNYCPQKLGKIKSMRVQDNTCVQPCCPPVEGTITRLLLDHEECQALQKLPDIDGLTKWLGKGPSCPSSPTFYTHVWKARLEIVEADKGNGCKVVFADRFLPEARYELSVESV